MIKQQRISRLTICIIAVVMSIGLSFAKGGDDKEKDKEKDKEYNSTKNYKPVGIYNSDILQKIQNKFTT